MSAIKEESDLGKYFCMSYKEGDKLNDEEMELVKDKMKVAFDYSETVDATYGIGKATIAPKNVQAQEEEIPVIEDDPAEGSEEDIDVKDIPF